MDGLTYIILIIITSYDTDIAEELVDAGALVAVQNKYQVTDVTLHSIMARTQSMPVLLSTQIAFALHFSRLLDCRIRP